MCTENIARARAGSAGAAGFDARCHDDRSAAADAGGPHHRRCNVVVDASDTRRRCTAAYRPSIDFGAETGGVDPRCKLTDLSHFFPAITSSPRGVVRSKK